MSPVYFEDKLNIDSVCVIGAGPSGIAAAKYLAAEKKFSRIEVFEQRSSVGGVWNYTPLNVVEEGFTVPRTRPTTLPDTAVWTDDAVEAQFVSPVYDFLETNIPNNLMNYCDQAFPEGTSLFPKHAVVKQYLEDCARDLRPMISLGTQVLSIEKIQRDMQMVWQVQTLHLKSNVKRTTAFDAVVVASGHYNDPFIPDIKGLHEFNEQHPGCVSHSKFYRRPDPFAGKKVIVVGNSASGIDISAQIATVSQTPLFISEKTPQPPTTTTTTAAEDKARTRLVPQITEFLPGPRAVRFADGTLEPDIDAVVFCTGYFYSFPFLQPSPSSPVTVTVTVPAPDGSHARRLYQHLLYLDDPTLAFLGIPQRVVPFPLAEAQACYLARLWSDRLPLPPRSEMQAWWDAATLRPQQKGAPTHGGGGDKSLHNLAFPRDVAYINHLHDLSLAARPVPGLLDHGGAGKPPPYWGPEKAWARERFPLIKIASRALGEERHRVKTLEELGFDYGAWRAAREAEGKLL
ncbi:putative flavin dependent monooxygenase [Xylariaceae sp. FL0016]|nr:putative flavin dependent monooxygenase [Xylariaceae sp. FL0016]